MRLACFNAVVCGAMWALGGYVLDLNSNPIDFRTWTIGVPFLLVALFSSWGAILAFLKVETARISRIVFVSFASACIAISAVCFFSYLAMTNLTLREELATWQLAGLCFFLALGTLLGFLQGALVAGFAHRRE